MQHLDTQWAPIRLEKCHTEDIEESVELGILPDEWKLGVTQERHHVAFDKLMGVPVAPHNTHDTTELCAIRNSTTQRHVHPSDSGASAGWLGTHVLEHRIWVAGGRAAVECSALVETYGDTRQESDRETAAPGA